MDERSRWIAFAVLCTAFFMLLLDFSIVSIALPAIQSGLHVDSVAAQWLISAYAIVFSGFLMFSGRCADIVGHRRFFIGGLTLFTVASFVGGLSSSAGLLILMRALQGFGAAAVNPAALAIVTQMFSGPQRSRAIGFWGVAASVGVVVGMFLGGVLVAFLGWRSVFFVNVPVGFVLLVLTPKLVPKDRFDRARPRLDAWGAVLLTATLLLLTFTIVRGPDDGFGSVTTLFRAAGVVVLFAAYLFAESRAAEPLVPKRLFRIPDLTPSLLLSLFQAAAYAGLYIYVSEYLQNVLHQTPLEAGIFFIPATLVMACVSGPLSAPLVARIGARAVGIFGSIFMIGGCGMLLKTSVPGVSYLTGLLPATVLASFGCMFTYEVSMIAGLAKVPEDDEGLASAAISTMAQMGLSIGVAVAAAVEIDRTLLLRHAGESAQTALAGGLNAAFWSPLAFSVLTLISALCISGAIVGARRHFHFGKLALASREASAEAGSTVTA